MVIQAKNWSGEVLTPLRALIVFGPNYSPHLVVKADAGVLTPLRALIVFGLSALQAMDVIARKS